MADGAVLPFLFSMEDPGGNSFISFDTNLYLDPHQDPRMSMSKYERTKQQMIDMGYLAEEDPPNLEDLTLEDAVVEEEKEPNFTAHNMDFSTPIDENKVTDEALVFNTPCFSCKRDGHTKMCVVNVPHFKEVVIMAFRCDFCGAKSNEVKGGGQVSPGGLEVTL
jgi:zinc finger protein